MATLFSTRNAREIATLKREIGEIVNFMDGSGNSQKTKSGTEKRSQKLSKYDEKTFNKTRVIVKKRDRRTRVKNEIFNDDIYISGFQHAPRHGQEQPVSSFKNVIF